MFGSPFVYCTVCSTSGYVDCGNGRKRGREERRREKRRAEVSEHNSTSPVCSTVVYRVVPPNSTAQHGNAAVALSDSPTLFVDAIVVKTRDSARGKDSVSAF